MAVTFFFTEPFKQVIVLRFDFLSSETFVVPIEVVEAEGAGDGLLRGLGTAGFSWLKVTLMVGDE
jgi:hypothetical protein